MKKNLIIAAGGAAILVCVLVAVFGLRWYQDNRKPGFSDNQVLYVYPGMSASDVADSLLNAGIVLKPRSLARSFRKENVAEGLKVGRYELKSSSPTIYAARMLTHGWQTAQNMTLSGSLRTKERIASLIGHQMLVDEAEVLEALRDGAFLSAYGTDTTQVMGFILPDTYQMYWTSSIEEIFARFKKEYDAFWTAERVEKARAQGLTPREASVVASIVNGETRQAQEYPKIAGVYLNRLHKGMKLQADPTICYCYGYTLNRVLKKHLEVESPYNTYKYAGLPPGPISCPPKACIDAVLNPDRHGYIFFCANASFDGTHKFAVTYDEHMRNARDFQKALSRRLAEKAAAAAASSN